MDKSLKQARIIMIIFIVLAAIFLLVAILRFAPLLHLLLSERLAYNPKEEFIEVFPEYDISFEEIDRIEVGVGDRGENNYRMRTLSDEDAKAYLERLHSSYVQLNRREKRSGEKLEKIGDYKAVFYLKNGEMRELILTFRGDPSSRQQINDTYYYNSFVNAYDGLFWRQ